jgi:hypothetical protein
MLEQPRPQNVGGHFGENAALLLILFAVRVLVVFTCTVAAADTGITGVTCNRYNKQQINSFAYSTFIDSSFPEK